MCGRMLKQVWSGEGKNIQDSSSNCVIEAAHLNPSCWHPVGWKKCLNVIWVGCDTGMFPFSTGALLAVQFVHAKITRMVSTAEGFVATTQLGYLMRERFQAIKFHYDMLSSVKATYTVKSRPKESQDPGEIRGNLRNAQSCTNKLSQICRIVWSNDKEWQRMTQISTLSSTSEFHLVVSLLP